MGKGHENPAKLFLSQYRALSNQIESLLKDVQRQRDLLTNITIQLKPDVVKGGGASDRMAEAIAQIVDTEAQFAETVKETIRIQREIMDAIKSVKNETQKAVLMLRYIEGLDWISIQERIGYERTQTLVYHGRALIAVNKWMEERNNVQKPN